MLIILYPLSVSVSSTGLQISTHYSGLLYHTITTKRDDEGYHVHPVTECFELLLKTLWKKRYPTSSVCMSSQTPKIG